MSKSLYSKEYRNVVTKLRAARTEANLTQSEVAQKLKKPQSYVSKIERGERRLDVTELATIGELYNKPIDWFIEKVKERNTKQSKL